jgi:hypothetical protein
VVSSTCKKGRQSASPAPLLQTNSDKYTAIIALQQQDSLPPKHSIPNTANGQAIIPMNDQQYLQYARERLAEFSRTLVLRSSHLPEDDPLRGLAQAFEAANLDTETLYAEVPQLINRLFTTYTDFAPTFPRDLLWFFGGDCLHFMPDEEIAVYQQLDELRTQAAARGEIFDLKGGRAKLLKLQ